MNKHGFKFNVFFTTLVSTLVGVIPSVGCNGVCGSCYRCAGAGGVIAILIAIGVARKRTWTRRPI